MDNLTKSQIASLKHWEKCFRNGTVDDEHWELIADILAKEIEKAWVKRHEAEHLKAKNKFQNLTKNKASDYLINPTLLKED